MLEHIQKLEDSGMEIFACTTYLEYFDLMDKLAVGKPTTMMKSTELTLNGELIAL